MGTARAAVGVADHNGWAVLVTVATRAGEYVVVDRRRVELVEPGLSSQPYHHEAPELPLAEAKILVERVNRSVASRAKEALARLRADLSSKYAIGAIGIREGPTPAVPTRLEDVLASRRATFAADGEMYRRALCDAAVEVGLDTVTHPRRDPLTAAASALQVDAEDAALLIKGFGRELGPPWQKDHRNASAAALAALAAPASSTR